MITNVDNSFFRTATFPQFMKKGQVTPLLKKPGLDITDFKNVWPITNLTTISKIIERLALQRLRPYLAPSQNYCRLQSAYFTGQSTKTALVKIVDYILGHIDGVSVVTLVSLDISAAFDMVDHNVLLERLSVEFGVTGAARDWIASYLRSRSFFRSHRTIIIQHLFIECRRPSGISTRSDTFYSVCLTHRSSHREFWHRVPWLRRQHSTVHSTQR